MKLRDRVCGLVVCGALLAPVVRGATADNPYDKIVARNLFGLKDPPPPPSPESTKPPAPPITLQGFTTILGRSQVLFKIAQPARPPQPAVEVSKILGEGERDGDVGVLEINLAERSVKFDNYGTVEVKNMKDHAAKPSGAPINLAGGIPQPGLSTPQSSMSGAMMTPSATAANTAAATATPAAGLSARASGLQNTTTRQQRTGATAASPVAGQNWPPENHLSGEDQDLFIEALRQAGQHSDMLPPTKLNPTANQAPTPTTKTTKPQ